VGVAPVDYAQRVKKGWNYMLISTRWTSKISLSSERNFYPKLCF